MPKDERFKNVPIDNDTKILFESIMKFDGEDILYQKWRFDGIVGESIIFRTENVGNMSDKELIEYIATSDIVTNKSSITISRNDDTYTFLNFNFITN